MKLINKFILTLFAGMAMMSCEREYDAPPLNEPHYNGPEANITIQEIKDRFPESTEAQVISEDLILKAYITGNDISGNIYKKLYLQDETGALEMEIDLNNAANTYAVGQLVYINLKGLDISYYQQTRQLGYKAGVNSRIPEDMLKEHVMLDGWPDPTNVQPEEITDLSILAAQKDKYEYRLVTLKDVTFDNGGKATFSVAQSPGENQNLKDAQGNSIVVRTSGYSNFALDMLPAGKGNLTGILATYRGGYQFMLRSREDISGFNGSSDTDNNGGTLTAGIVLNVPFSGSDNGGFKEQIISKDNSLNFVWKVSTNDLKGSSYYKTNLAAEARFVSPVIDLGTVNQPVIAFEHVIAYINSDKPTDHFALEIREAGTEAWTKLTVPNFPNKKDLFEPARIDIAAYKGKKVEIAFYYKGTTTTAPTWKVKNLKVGESSAIPETSAGTGGTSTTNETVGGGSLDTNLKKAFSLNLGTVQEPADKKSWPYIEQYAKTEPFPTNNPGLTITNTSNYKASVRSTGGGTNIWFAATKDIELTISGIKAKAGTGTMEVGLGSNGNMDLKIMQITVNGTVVSLPGNTVIGSGETNKPHTFYIQGVNLKADNEIVFKTNSENTGGIRLYTINIYQ